MGAMRTYRVHLPANYATSKLRYPVIYWMHAYESGEDARQAALAAWAVKHDAIVVDSGPAETSGNYPLYLPELVEQIDRTLRTMADRYHRGVSGFGGAGLLALWQAAKVPHLIGKPRPISPARPAASRPRRVAVHTALPYPPI